MKKIITILLCFLCSAINAQQEASNWYFGDNAGISFDLNGNITALNDGQLATDEGCTSISDSNGNLLFYTDGRTVWNSLHQTMSNANESPFSNRLFGDASSTQSAIIIPKPNDPNIYYIFTVDTPSLDGEDLGFHFSEVDMTLNGGLGDVTALKNQQLLSNTSEKLSAVLKDCNSQSIWVITFADENFGESNNSFYAYEVTDTGVNTTPVVSNIGLQINETRGYLKFSPDGTKLAAANITSGLYLFDFDTTTGIVSNPNAININFSTNEGSQNPYGIEFSPNNELLYVSTYRQAGQGDFNNPNAQYGALLQYNLQAVNISASEIVIDQRQTYRSGLQLGPNGKIYRAMSNTYNNGSPFLSVINNPNIAGTGCNYQNNAVQLTSNSRQGLPPFITSFFTENIDIIQNGIDTTSLNLCIGDLYTLMSDNIANATYSWTLDGNPLTETDFDLDISGPGFYEVLIELNDGNCGFLRGEANVSYFEYPIANQPSNILVCDDNNDGISNFNFTEQTNSVLDTQNPLNFEVKYFRSMDDATSQINEIIGDFQNTTNPQTIYARAQSIGNNNCYDITSFEVYIYNTPQITSNINLETCDVDANPMDGITSIDLSNFNATVIGNQNAAQYTVTYHPTLVDAEAGQNGLPNNYTNQTAFNENVFVRIENNNNTNCYNTEEVIININPIPEAFDVDIYQCDNENTVDGFTTFNLTEVNEAITGNAADRIVQFYLTQNNAQNDIAPINGMSYNNTLNPQTIYVRVTNTITGCFNTSALLLEVSDTQISDYSAPEVCDELNSEDGIHAFNLNDFSNAILNGLPAGLNIEYYETYNEALIEQNPLSSPYENTIPYSQTIYVRVENDNACYGINEVQLTINPLPSLEDDETILYCLNDFPQTITLESGTNENNPNIYDYTWSNGETTESIEVNTPGNYTVTAINATTGCNKSRTIIVEPSNIATIEDISIIDGSINNNQISIVISGEGEYQYALTNQDGDSTPFQSNSTFTGIPPGIYTVIVKDIKNNCGSITKLISVIGFPLYFTPNNDTINDTWQVYGVSAQFQRNSIIHIFDRFGKLITTLDPAGKGWDGTFNGNVMPASDYWFSVTLEDGRIYKNHFTLKR
ncbi:T9SS type B sorting domain-containing protein [uncultured Lacinutrix sp.]|uniref:T9SS type B sorting domain-containing protein n=1 Tax=uncultured Lacinutrix sp. TaxID=574032 RepID=UPI002624FEA9|nr:T9SS type B sorting domain-containing protein [uncultured Lacinutrix sp.]